MVQQEDSKDTLGSGRVPGEGEPPPAVKNLDPIVRRPSTACVDTTPGYAVQVARMRERGILMRLRAPWWSRAWHAVASWVLRHLGRGDYDSVIP